MGISDEYVFLYVDSGLELLGDIIINIGCVFSALFVVIAVVISFIRNGNFRKR